MLELWADLKNDFSDTLLLGNGASIAIDEKFKYSSLLSVAQNSGLITDQLTNLFSSFDTDDFELVLEVISHARTVNKILEINDKLTESVYEELRNSLISTIQNVHTTYDIVSKHFSSIQKFTTHFKTIINLNYDLVFYWAMIHAKEKYGNWFKDCFIDGEFKHSGWKDLRKPWRAKGSTLVFYPHGSLSLALDTKRKEFKISVGEEQNNLLGIISNAWKNDGASPLFVSEGDTNQKMDAIRRSTYLSKVYDSVLSSAKTVTIFGWSMSDNDKHILKQICWNADALAIGINNNDKTQEKIKSVCEEFLFRIKKYSSGLDVHFFNAQEPGVWIYG